MRQISKLLYPVVFSTLAVITAFSVYADKTGAISVGGPPSATAVYADELLDSPLSPGIRVMAYERPLIVSGMSGEKIQFSAEIFNDHNGYVPSTVKIMSVPSESAGTLVYNSESVTVGQSVSVLSLSSLYYSPKDSSDAEFTFSPDNSNVMRCIIRQKNTENTPPKILDNSAVTTYTRIDTAVSGYLQGMDSDGDAVSYEIVSFPAKGIISVTDRDTGNFIYHPYEGVSGDDSFSYRVRDSYGAYSAVQTVSLSVERMTSVCYNDTEESNNLAAINTVIDAGIMKTSKTKDGEFFNPDEQVSRIDFLIMAMKALGAGEPEKLSSTVFTDDGTLTDTERGYLAAAKRLGIISGAMDDGKLVFMPDDAVTGAHAAVMLNGILGLSGDSSVYTSIGVDSIPTWAVQSVVALTHAGIINKYTAPTDSYLTRENAAVILSELIHRVG